MRIGHGYCVGAFCESWLSMCCPYTGSFILRCFCGFLWEPSVGSSNSLAERMKPPPAVPTPNSSVPGYCCFPYGPFSHPHVHLGEVTFRKTQGWLPDSLLPPLLLSFHSESSGSIEHVNIFSLSQSLRPRTLKNRYHITAPMHYTECPLTWMHIIYLLRIPTADLEMFAFKSAMLVISPQEGRKQLLNEKCFLSDWHFPVWGLYKSFFTLLLPMKQMNEYTIRSVLLV